MFFLQPSDLDAILLSFKVACTATLLSTPLGIGVAYLLVHTRIPGKSIIEGIVNLPLVLPPVVIGYLLLVLFGRRGWVGSWLLEYNIQIIFTLTGAIIPLPWSVFLCWFVRSAWAWKRSIHPIAVPLAPWVPAPGMLFSLSPCRSPGERFLPA